MTQQPEESAIAGENWADDSPFSDDQQAPIAENATIEHAQDSVEHAIEARDDADAGDAGDKAADPPPAPSAESHEVPIHRVLCLADGCKCGATYRPTASGTGLMFLERYGMDIETILGIGPSGRPDCPHGHGEMTFADEQLPIEQAISQVNERLEEKQRAPRLPFPAPPVNYDGFFQHIKKLRHEVISFEKKWDELKERTKGAKEDFDKANEKLGEIIDEYEEREAERQFEIERRIRQNDAGHPDGTTLVRCLYEQLQPEDLCPLCTGDPAIVVKFLGHEIAARDGSAHVDQVAAYRTKMDVEETEDALGSVVERVPIAAILEWTPDERAAVRVWAFAVVDVENGGKIQPPDRPAVLGTPHVVADKMLGADAKVVTCGPCGAVLQQLVDDDAVIYPVGRLVGIDCPGADAEIEPHRYPDTKKKRAARPRTTEKPAKIAKTAPPKNKGAKRGK